MELHRELVPNRRTQADTKTRKMATVEMASATRSPIRPLRGEDKPVVEVGLLPPQPLALRAAQSPVGVLDAAAVDPEEQKQQTVEGQKARGSSHKVAEGGG